MRPTYPEAERQYKWLSNLLDTYAIADEGVAATKGHYSKSGDPIACKKGCSACCKNPSVPFTQPEMQGISWYVSEVLDGDVRQVVKARLENHASTTECPFLVNDQCAAYAVRPLICRQFMVKNRPCVVDEHVDDTRPTDMVMPAKSSIQKVAVQLMNFWAFPNRRAKIDAFENGFIATHAKEMHLYDWREVARLMSIFESQR